MTKRPPCKRCGGTGKIPGLHPKTINDELALVTGLLGLARKYRIIAEVPVFERLKVPPPAFDFLTEAEADRLVAAAEPEWRAMIQVALLTGLRRGELRALRWTDVDLVAQRLTVNVAADDRGVVTPPKSGRSRTVDLGEDAVQVLRAHRHLRGPLVFCADDGRAFTQRQLENPIARACRRAGLRSVGWHALRHTYASWLVQRGAPLTAVQALLGHSTLAMVLRYAHLSPDARRAAARLLDRPSTSKKADER